MRLLALGLLSLLSLFGDLAAAVRTKVDLVNLTPDIRPGEKALIAMRFRCDPHFHIYWKNPGDAGQSPTVEWQEKSGATVGDFVWPGPKMLDQSGVYNFVYEDETLLLMEVAVPAGAKGALTFKGKAEWLECDDSGCWPHDKQVELTVQVGAGNVAYKYDPKLYPTLRPRLTTTATSDGKSLTVAVPAGEKLPQTWFPERGFVAPTATAKQKQAGGNVVFELADATEKLDSGELIFTTRAADGGFVDIKAVLGGAPAKAAPGPAATPTKTTGEWQPWSPETQAKALAEGKTVYVDFTARWCATCQTNKKIVFASDEVLRYFAENRIVALRADWTNKDPRITTELARFQRSAVPFNVLWKPGRDQPVILPELLTPGIVLDALRGK